MKSVVRATAALVLVLNLAACAMTPEPRRLDPNAQVPEAGQTVE